MIYAPAAYVVTFAWLYSYDDFKDSVFFGATSTPTIDPVAASEKPVYVDCDAGSASTSASAKNDEAKRSRRGSGEFWQKNTFLFDG
jgi:hypothetical protein